MTANTPKPGHPWHRFKFAKKPKRTHDPNWAIWESPPPDKPQDPVEPATMACPRNAPWSPCHPA